VVVGGVLGLGLLAVGALNYAVDPMAQFGTNWVPPVVQTSRAQKANQIRKQAGTIEGLVLGSSRVLKLEPEYLEKLTGLRFYNAGVNHGRPEDWLALVRLFRDTQGHYPKVVVLGVDVTSFEDRTPPDLRLVASSDLRARVPESISSWDSLGILSGLFSLQQTKASLGSLRRLVQHRNETPLESFRDDGVIVYHEREQQLLEGTYDFESALDYNRREYLALFRHFDQLSEKRCALFAKTLEILRSNNTRVYLFLTPTHPRLMSALSDESNTPCRIDDVREYLRDVAAATDSDFVDLGTLDMFDGDQHAFIDGIHPLELNTRRMMARMFETCEGEPIYAVQ
jgi:hypothetical protein